MLRRIAKSLKMGLARLFSLLYEISARQILANRDHSVGTVSKLSLKGLLQTECTIVEVGCHVGIDTMQFSLLFPKGKIFAFEPNMDLLFEAHSRLRYRGNIILYPVALSSKSGLQEFYASYGTSTGSGSLLEPTLHLRNHPEVHFHKNDDELVFTSTLDEIQSKLNLDCVDLLWIDAQGAELEVLKGSIDTLERVRYIYSEVSTEPLYLNGATYAEIRSFLFDRDFDVLEEFLPLDWGGEGNVLFVNRKLILDS